jgi:hypothetical protein
MAIKFSPQRGLWHGRPTKYSEGAFLLSAAAIFLGELTIIYRNLVSPKRVIVHLVPGSSPKEVKDRRCHPGVSGKETPVVPRSLTDQIHATDHWPYFDCCCGGCPESFQSWLLSVGGVSHCSQKQQQQPRHTQHQWT